MRNLRSKKMFVASTCLSMLVGSLCANQDDDSFKTSKEHFKWNSPIQLAFDFSDDASSRPVVPEHSVCNDVIAYVDSKEIQHKITSQRVDYSHAIYEAHAAEFIKALVQR